MQSRIPTSSFLYLAVIITGIVLGQFLDYVTYLTPYLMGQSLGLLFQLASTIVALVFWIQVKNSGTQFGLGRKIFVIMMALWVAATIHARLDQASFNYSALSTPIILLMIVSKPPSRRDAWRLADFTFVLLAILAMLTQLLDFLNLRNARDAFDTRLNVPLLDIGLRFRWEGYFGDPNYAGLIGAALAVYGLYRFGLIRVLLVIVGSVIVVSSDSRTAVAALIVGLIVSALVHPRARKRLRQSTAIQVVAGMTIFVGVLAAVGLDPSLNGRVQIWMIFLEHFRSEPLAGVGWSGIGLVASTADASWKQVNLDGHSVLIDALARHGVFAGLLVSLVLVMSLRLVWRARVLDDGVSLSVFVVWLTGALTYTVTMWQNLTVLMVPFMVSLLVAYTNQPEKQALSPGTRRTILFAVTSPISLRLFGGRLQRLADLGYDLHIVTGEPVRQCYPEVPASATLHQTDMKRTINVVGDLRALLRLVVLLRRLKPAVVVAATPKASLVTLLAASISRVPVRVWEVWGARWDASANWRATLLRFADRLVSMSASHVYAVAPSLAELIRSAGITRSLPRVASFGSSHGVNVNEFFPKRIHMDEQFPTLGFAGRLSYDKGIEDLYLVAQRIRERWPRLRLLLVGEIDESDPPPDYVVQALETADWIHITGWVSHAAPFYHEMDVFVFPSIREGLPNAVLEAAASGLPVVAYIATGTVDAVDHGRNGFLVARGDRKQLETSVASILASAEMRSTFSAASRRLAVDRFDSNQVEQCWTSMYEEIFQLAREHTP